MGPIGIIREGNHLTAARSSGAPHRQNVLVIRSLRLLRAKALNRAATPSFRTCLPQAGVVGAGGSGLEARRISLSSGQGQTYFPATRLADNVDWFSSRALSWPR
jgi:hypothetical protein